MTTSSSRILPHVGVVAPILAAAFGAGMLLSTDAPAQEGPPGEKTGVQPAPVAAESFPLDGYAGPTDVPRLRRDMKPLGVFGIGLGVHGLGTFLTLILSLAGDEMSDASLETGYGVLLGVAPFVDAGVGYLLMRSSRTYAPSFGSILLGSFIGSALAYVGVAASVERDDPKVDGKYDDSDYFGDSDAPPIGILTLIVLPVLLPPAGAAFGALAGRTPKEPLERTAFTVRPPEFRLFSAAPGQSARVPGISLTATF